MQPQFSRTALLIGEEALGKLAQARVAVFGLGGVGSYAVEGLARGGVGALDLIDNDVYSISNLNRQLYATLDTIGRPKTEIAAERVRSINPDCVVTVHNTFVLPESIDQFDFAQFDYVIDAIDTVSGKLALIECACRAGTPIISSMGTGNKLDPTRFEVADIYDTSVCPLAKVMRTECRKRNIPRCKVLYSKEQPLAPRNQTRAEEGDGVTAEQPPKGKRAIPGSISFVPPVAGLILAGEVIKDIIGYSAGGAAV